MTQRTTPERSAQMARVRSKNTKPELVVRKLAHSLGYRYRLNRRDLPGTPDLVFPRLKKIIFVHGCFWHQHKDANCWRSRIPKTRQDFWIPKLQGNVARDTRSQDELRRMGWDVLVVWECETTPSQIDKLKETISDFLSH
ncbi:very short patch repair endonuclease [Parvibaculum indicum]|uniref:very short patch repair endonuclease n=1 Tax=Parvibaculum indicum TaxID=562969 RepID=UPI00141EF84B|nr:very short patch repair endonuclease [Parvibaculum indicum]